MRIEYVIKLDFRSLSVCGIRPNVTSLREKSYIHTSFKVKKKTEAIINRWYGTLVNRFYLT